MVTKKSWLIVTILVIAVLLQGFSWYQYHRLNKAVETFSIKVESANDQYDVAKAFLEFQTEITPVLQPLSSEASNGSRPRYVNPPSRPRRVTTDPCDGKFGYFDGRGRYILCGSATTTSGGSGGAGSGSGWFAGLCGSGGKYNDYLCPIGGKSIAPPKNN